MASLRSASALCSTSGATNARPFRAQVVPSLPSRRVSVTVRAMVQPPKGVTLPQQGPQSPPPTFGFVDFAEKLNSRACMMGFFALLAVEGLSGKGLLEQMGFEVGRGLGFSL
eukprot:CAMPEP_0119106738 /NCGR_PEP_ID=MMETSP1180-20130426/6293_1 /TAXON_ID=3052 ORGANISM="Chlamydomonas cf sp, Strain CCMP681" /NCGR_SAMPLE_ID=MMETSP1180 /ASSEMBLY_ACC=CAM_ASM_000741 /LENGTH=111 /DNA_ID=CAMNT_0007092121 /DNA_START=47 /DNA_END=382 /DNA_ORIENTATION=-